MDAGLYAVYCGDEQLAEFIAESYEPTHAELIEAAKRALDDAMDG